MFIIIIRFAVVNFAIVHIYYNSYLQVDVEDFGVWSLAQEGMTSSAGLFMTVWIIMYSAMNGNYVEI